MSPNQFAVGLVLWMGIATAQKPVIPPGGVVNAASYSIQGGADGSIVSIFGSNLAASPQAAKTVPLPTFLAGTSVTLNGIAVPLFFVSPNQINFQVPTPNGVVGATPGLVVTTAAGSSDLYDTNDELDSAMDSSLGIFTLDGSGCGLGAIFNVAPDGSLSLNSQANSASPGQYLATYATGLGLVGQTIANGSPAPATPLTNATTKFNGVFDFQVTSNSIVDDGWWAGRAPGLIGVDQFNLQVPANARQGCAVPFQVLADSVSQPVMVAIRSGGGQCVDPPGAGYGLITWAKSFITSSSNAVTETDTVTVSIHEAPGAQGPPSPVFGGGYGTVLGDIASGASVYSGPACRILGYRSLDAGTVTAQGPGVGPVTLPVVPLQQGQVTGLTIYQATLPPGTIQGEQFTVSASGGADVGPFQSNVQIGFGLQFPANFAGMVFPCNKPVTISWTGNDANALVTVTKIHPTGGYDFYSSIQAPLTAGSVTFEAPDEPPPSSCPDVAIPISLLIEETPGPSEVSSFSASGLSLGGQHTWKYTYLFPAFAQ